MSVGNVPRITFGLLVAMALAGSAAGAGGRAEVTRCAKWKVVSSPMAGKSWNSLEGVAVRSTSDVWAVGTYESGDFDRFTTAQHWDGNSWTVVPTPNASQENWLTDVTVVGRNEAWAVGHYTNAETYTRGFAMHWDGGTWSLMFLPTKGVENYVHAVDGVSPSEVWAAGFGNGRAWILRWDGTSWAESPVPDVGGRTSILYALDARTRSDVWAAGYRIDRFGVKPIVVHWNGRRWRNMRLPRPKRFFESKLHGIAAASVHSVWAVGYAKVNTVFEGSGLVAHWNGRSWSMRPIPKRKSADEVLYDVDAVPGRGAWAVGISTVNELDKPLVVSGRGRDWRRRSSPYVEVAAFWGIDLLSGVDGWAVGPGPGYAPLIERLRPC